MGLERSFSFKLGDWENLRKKHTLTFTLPELP